MVAARRVRVVGRTCAARDPGMGCLADRESTLSSSIPCKYNTEDRAGRTHGCTIFAIPRPPGIIDGSVSRFLSREASSIMTMLDRMRRHKAWLKWSLAIVVLAFILFLSLIHISEPTRLGM